MKRAIRQRIENSSSDLAILFHHLEQKYVRDAFGSNAAQQTSRGEIINDELEDPTDPPVTAANSPYVFAFFLRGLNYGEEQIYPPLEDMAEEQPALKYFRRELEEGIRIYLQEEQNYLADVDVTIDLDIKGTTDDLTGE
jgi:hypothetical protein